MNASSMFTSTQGRSALACECLHMFITEGGVVQCDGMAPGDGPTGHSVQPAQPGVGVAGVVDGAPVSGLGAPHSVDAAGDGVGELGEIPLL